MADIDLVATGDTTINSRGEEVTFFDWMERADNNLVAAGFNPLVDHGKKGYHAADIIAMQEADEFFGIDSGIDPDDHCCDQEEV